MADPAASTSIVPAPPTWKDARLFVAVLAAAATAPAIWWLLGLFTRFSVITDPDYMIEPPAISARAEWIIGGSSSLVATGGMAMVYALIRGRTWSIRWAGVVGPLFVGAAYAGLTYRAVTAPVIGANIGGGLLIFGAVPVALCLIVIAIVFALPPRRLRAPRI